MGNWHDIMIQAIGFLGVLFFFISFQTKTNKSLFVMQTLGCLTFSIQFALLGALSGCLSLLINVVRNIMLTKYNDCRVIRWKGWVAVFSALSLAAALFTWNGWYCILPVIGTTAGTIGYWTNNARKIRFANIAVTSPCLLIYDTLIRSWGGVLNESITILSIVVSVIRFGWKALDGDKIEK